jgi:hypothetical protein
MVALGATKQSLPNSGDLPCTGRMSAIEIRLSYKAKTCKAFYLANLRTL